MVLLASPRSPLHTQGSRHIGLKAFSFLNPRWPCLDGLLARELACPPLSRVWLPGVSRLPSGCTQGGGFVGVGAEVSQISAPRALAGLP